MLLCLVSPSLIAGIFRILLTCTTAQFIISTVHVASGLRALIEGFIWHNTTPAAIIFYWRDQSLPVHLLQEAATITNVRLICTSFAQERHPNRYTVLARGPHSDLAVIHSMGEKAPDLRASRLDDHCVRRYDNQIHSILCLAECLYLSHVVCGYISIWHLSRLFIEPSSVNLLLNWLKITYSLSLATQVGVALLIASRIWWVSRFARQNSSRFGTNSAAVYMKIIWTIVESGAIYALNATLLLAFFDNQKQAGTILGDSIGQISVCLLLSSCGFTSV